MCSVKKSIYYKEKRRRRSKSLIVKAILLLTKIESNLKYYLGQFIRHFGHSNKIKKLYVILKAWFQPTFFSICPSIDIFLYKGTVVQK
jgi:hypothetical protein